MFITEKRKRLGKRPPPDWHADCELLLEKYHRQVSDVNHGSFFLRKKIQSAQDLVKMNLDNYRNRLMR